MLLLRDYGTLLAARGSGAGDRLRAERPSAGRARQCHHRLGRGSFFASIGRRRRRSICRTVRCRRPERCSPTRALAATYLRILAEAERAGGDRVAQIEAARKSWSQGFVAEAIDRFCRTQDVMDSSGDAAPRRAHRRRHGALDAARRSAAHLRLRPLHGLQDRAVGPRPGDAAATGAAQGFRSRRARSGRRGLHPFAGRVRQARIRRPRGVSMAIPISSRCRWRRLLSDAYNVERRKLVDDTASLELRPGSIPGFGGK